MLASHGYDHRMRADERNPRDRGSYLLGHDPGELRRLGAQARVIDPITRHFLLSAGLVPGMRVLDVGSGAGDVAFLAADIVGEGGSVTGVDRSADAIATASAAASTRGLSNVSFVLADLAAIPGADRYDAIIGRYVLQWLRDPAGTLRSLAGHLDPDGIVVFHEIDWTGSSSKSTGPTLGRHLSLARRDDPTIRCGDSRHERVRHVQARRTGRADDAAGSGRR